MAKKKKVLREDHLTPDIRAILQELDAFLDGTDAHGNKPCNARRGIYAFFDYDGEPIYVGQTYEALRIRIRRHITNQRTDAVAMRVLDPMEVAQISVWPFPQDISYDDLNAAEYTVYQRLSAEARVSRLLNEVMPKQMPLIDLPDPYQGWIIPEAIRPRLSHPDERIARRAATIAGLAQVIRERNVSAGLRQTFVTQAERLLLLAHHRLTEVIGETPSDELQRETQRSGPEELAEED